MGAYSRCSSPFYILDQHTTIFRDTHLLAALLTYDPNTRYYPRRDALGRVVFEVRGAISDKMGRLDAGDPAPLSTYIKNLEMLHSTIAELQGAADRRNSRGK